MKNGLNIHFLCAVIFALGLVLLVETGPAGSAETREKDENANGCSDYRTTRFELKCQPTGKKEWLLTYRFKGSPEKWHEVTCRIRDADVRLLESSFGFRESDWHAAEANYFQEAILAAYRRLQYGTVRVAPGTREARWVQTLRPLNSAEELVVAAEKQDFDRWYAQNVQATYDKAVERFRNERGFIVHPQLGWIPDYSGLIGRSSQAMQDCAKQLRQATGEKPELLMEFFQSMRFLPIELTEGGKYTGGLRLPLSLMISARGDCDSKATTFCLVQTRRVVMFRSLKGKGDRKHALVGVDAYPSKPATQPPKRSRTSTRAWEELEEKVYEDPILIDNVYYWPCEVSGGAEGSLQPLFKQVATGHGGKYVPVPIRPVASSK